MIDTLMTIDDEPIDQKLYKRLIDRSDLVGTLHQFLTAGDALAFLEGDDAPPVDVILLDINMPGMNGFEFLEAATNRLGDAFVRYAVVMISTSNRREDEDRARSFSVVRDFLHKPLTLGNLQDIDRKLNTA